LDSEYKWEIMQEVSSCKSTYVVGQNIPRTVISWYSYGRRRGLSEGQYTWCARKSTI